MTAASVEGSRLVADLMAYPPAQRHRYLATLDRPDLAAVLAASRRDLGTPYGIWRDDPEGFVSFVLGEAMWSKQRAIARAVQSTQRVAVPACFDSGKSHLAARLVAWFVCVHPVGTAQVVTTATRFRQVKQILWPHIKRVHGRYGLPGVVDTTQWRMPGDGGDEVVAYGFTAPAHDPESVQGVHAAHVLVVADEAGGIANPIGDALESALTGGDAHLLAIGNPSLDDAVSWFERLCDSADAALIRIAAKDTPAWTGEVLDACSCPDARHDPHTIGRHLLDQEWVARAIREYGADAPYVQTKVDALFAKGGGLRAIPYTWIEAAREPDRVADGEAVNLGVDVASDGGDELAIARWVGLNGELVHTSSGAENDDHFIVSGKVLAQIEVAERMARAAGVTRRVRVKVEAEGVGWAVYGDLVAWGKEGRHTAQIVAVTPGGSAKDSKKYANQRAEMWWEMRLAMQPPEGSQESPVVLHIDDKAAAQLAGPKYGHTSSSAITIERKKDMRSRGLRSPDRADALLLGLYEPEAVLEGSRVTSPARRQLGIRGARRGPLR
jgi:hypothetical protein